MSDIEIMKLAKVEQAAGERTREDEDDVSDDACPNCHIPHSGLVVTAPMGPDGAGVKHCGCFWEGDADGKAFHCSTTTPEQHAWMRGEWSETREPALTPSEVALAKILAAWEGWPGDLDHHRETLSKIGELLEAHLLLVQGQLSPLGRSLLARAQKAGVIGSS